MSLNIREADIEQSPTVVLHDVAECVTELRWRGDAPVSTKVYAVSKEGDATAYLVCDAYGYDLADYIAKLHNDTLEKK